MSEERITSTRLLFAGLALGIFFLPIPLLRNVHAESAAVASLLVAILVMFLTHRGVAVMVSTIRAGFFGTGIFLPLFFRDLIAGCLEVDGLFFWAIHLPGVLLFSSSLFWFFRQTGLHWLIRVVVVLWFMAGATIVEFYTQPKLYFFNHIWSFFPGPVYEQHINFSTNHLWFRLSSVLWVLFFVTGGVWWSNIAKRKELRWSDFRDLHFLGIILSLISLVALNLNSDRSGVSKSSDYLKSELSGQTLTANFQIHFHRESVSSDEVRYWELLHEFHFRDLCRLLEVDPQSVPVIHSFIYKHRWEKASMLGAGDVNFVPVWLAENQIHSTRQNVQQTLRHELVHVIAKDFGNRIINASWSGAMIEGLAVALAPEVSEDYTIDQLVKSKPIPDRDALLSSFGLLGFYTGRSGVNYTTYGSFLRFLFNNYPIEALKTAYRTGTLGTFDDSIEEFTNSWRAYLDTIPLPKEAALEGQRRFSRKSIFEKKCPRKVNKEQALSASVQQALIENDTLSAINELLRFMDYDSGGTASLWLQYLMLKDTDMVMPKKIELENHNSTSLLRADYLFNRGLIDEAQFVLTKWSKESEDSAAVAPELEARKDETIWALTLKSRYRPKNLAENDWLLLNPLQTSWAIEAWNDVLVDKHPFTETISSQAWLEKRAFNELSNLWHLCATSQNRTQAQKILSLMSSKAHSLRHIERYQETLRFHQFIFNESI